MLRASREPPCALAAGVAMAGGRKGRRKPGQGEPGGERAPRERGQKGRQAGGEIGAGDAEAEQWLSPFRIGRPVTPVISPRDASGGSPGAVGPRQVWHDAEPPGRIWTQEGPGERGRHQAAPPPIQAQPIHDQPTAAPPAAQPVWPAEPGYGPAEQAWHGQSGVPGDPGGAPGAPPGGGYAQAGGRAEGPGRGRWPGPADRHAAPGRQERNGPPWAEHPGGHDGYGYADPAAYVVPGDSGGPARSGRAAYAAPADYDQAGGYGPPAGYDRRDAPRPGQYDQARGYAQRGGYDQRTGYGAPGHGRDDGLAGPRGYGPPHDGYGSAGPAGPARDNGWPADGQPGPGDPRYAPIEGSGSGEAHPAPGPHGHGAGQRPGAGYGPPSGYVPADGYGPTSGGVPPEGYGPADGYGPAPRSGPADGRAADYGYGQGGGNGRADGYGPAGGYGPADGYVPADGYGPVGGYGPAAGHARADGYGRAEGRAVGYGHGPADGHGTADGYDRTEGRAAAAGYGYGPADGYGRDSSYPPGAGSGYGPADAYGNGPPDGHGPAGAHGAGGGLDPRGYRPPPDRAFRDSGYGPADDYAGERGRAARYDSHGYPPEQLPPARHRSYQQPERGGPRDGYRGDAPGGWDPARGRPGTEQEFPARMDAGPRREREWPESAAGAVPRLPPDGRRERGAGYPQRGDPAMPPAGWRPGQADGYWSEGGYDGPGRGGLDRGADLEPDSGQLRRHRAGAHGWHGQGHQGGSRPGGSPGPPGEAGRSAGAQRKPGSGPLTRPAALPPGPSAAASQEPGPVSAATASGARQASAPETAGPSAAGPPSPTGLIPPAVGSPPAAPVIDAGYGAAGPDDDTAPIPVILHGEAPPGGEPAGEAEQASATRMRGPFEPPGRTESAADGGPAAAPESARPQQPGRTAGRTSAAAMSPAARASVWAPASTTMDQIKDLYLTAEAIGEDALDKHFEQVSDRQRKLIREYFDQAVAGGPDGQDHG